MHVMEYATSTAPPAGAGSGDPTVPAEPSRIPMWQRALPLSQGHRRLLSYRTYRLYFLSNSTGNFGSTAQFLAQGWLMLVLAPAAWGLLAFLAVRFGAKSLLALPSGVIADRLPRTAIYAWTRVASGCASVVALGAFFLPGGIWILLGATALAAAAHAIDLPAHRALQGDVQPEDDLERGLSMTHSGADIASMMAPVIIFPLGLQFGAGAPLAISALAFFVAAVPAFRLPPAPPVHNAETGGKTDIFAAVRFVRGAPIVLVLLLAMALPSVIDKAVAVSLPSTSAGDSRLLGFALAAPEVGGILMGFVLTALGWRFAPWIPIASAIAYTTGLIAGISLGLIFGFGLIAPALFLAGCARMALITSALAGIQRHVPHGMRGRVLTF
jgi:MFS family permease